MDIAYSWVKLIRLPVAENVELLGNFGRMWNSTREKEIVEVSTMFGVFKPSVSDDVKELCESIQILNGIISQP